MRYLIVLLFGLVSAVCCGCSSNYGRTPEVYPASGKVVFGNGKPVSGAYIKFVPTSPEGVETDAEVGDDGTFVLKAIGDKEGAVAGTYQVYLDPHAPSPRPIAKTLEAKRSIPKAYCQRETSPWKAEIKREENQFTFTLK